MKFEKHFDEALVSALYSGREVSDRRLREARKDVHMAGAFDRACNVKRRTVEAVVYMTDGGPCPGCGVDIDERTGLPVRRRSGGHYGTRNDPYRNECNNCRHGEYLDEMFVRHHGAGKEALDKAGIGTPAMMDFVAARLQKGSPRVSHSFMASVAQFDLPIRFDRAADFEAISIRAVNIDDARRIVSSPDFDLDWWRVIPVDAELRPLQRWTETRLTATDESALDLASRDQRRQAEAAVNAEVRQFRAERLRAAGL